MKKNRIARVLLLLMTAGLLAGCSQGATGSGAGASQGSASAGENTDIIIWTSGEDYKNETYLNSLREKFPEYNITLEYMSSSSMAAKVSEEGDSAQVDIICSEEYGYLYMMEDHLATLDDFDFSQFLDDIVPDNHKFTPEVKNGGCIIINPQVLADRGLPVPVSYEDLLDPQYKGLISMPSPASSGTGYMFLKQLVNEWGEEEAFAYFEQLTENILQYTSSGSGPVNALVQGEVAIGLGMTSQAVVEISQGVDLEILFFEEGSPFSMYGNAMMAKSADRPAVREVFEYLATDLCRQNNEMYFPDQIFKDFAPEVEGFPKNIDYGDMSGDTREEKERLLARWTFS
ncbi:MAG: extracellular solute-binding protein [Lachnospiraceae bacterium]|nr:extracellular solute-binding protein [Lachnospiraceae bacterium]